MWQISNTSLVKGDQHGCDLRAQIWSKNIPLLHKEWPNNNIHHSFPRCWHSIIPTPSWWTDSRAAVGWHTLHGVPGGPCPQRGGGGKRHTQTWRSRLQCRSWCCVATICRKTSLFLISAQVFGYIDMGIRDSAKGCGVQVHRQQQLRPWK